MIDPEGQPRVTSSEAFEQITDDYQEHILAQEADALKQDLLELFPYWQPNKEAVDKEQLKIKLLFEGILSRFGYVLRIGVVHGATGYAFLDNDEMIAKEKADQIENSGS